MIKRLKSKLTMKKLRYEFTDIVDGRMVYRWRDCYGDEYLSFNKLGSRMKVKRQKEFDFMNVKN